MVFLAYINNPKQQTVTVTYYNTGHIGPQSHPKHTQSEN